MVEAVTQYYPRAFVGDGGLTAATWSWTSSLRRAGVDVEVVHDARHEQTSPVPAPGAAVRPVAHRGNGRRLRPVQPGEVPRPGRVLVLHSTYVAANLTVAAAARSQGVPYVVVPHGGYDPHLRQRRRALKAAWEPWERRMLEGALAVQVFFDSERQHVLDLAPRARVFTAATAFDVPDLERAGRGQDGYLAWVGRYDIHHKGLDLLLDAMDALPPEARPSVRMHGRDSTDSRAAVQRLVDARGLTGQVAVGGPVSGAAKLDFLLAARGYVHPSRWESYGMALVEALALGVPCLVTSGAAMADWLRAENAAVVCRPGTAGLAQGLRRLANDPVTDVAARGRALVRTHLTHEAAGLRWTRAVDEALSVRGARL